MSRKKPSPEALLNHLASDLVMLVCVLFGLVFAGIGLYCTWRSIKGRFWDEVPCVIEQFEIKVDEAAHEPFSLDLRYRYAWQGREYLGTRLVANSVENNRSGFERLIDAQVKLEQLAGGLQLADAKAYCRVNPTHPEQSALLPDAENLDLGLIFTAVGFCFAGIGIGVIRSSRMSGKRGSSQRAGDFTGLCVFSVFLLGGMLSAWGIIVQPMMRGFAAKQWTATPATVIWSKVKTHSGSKGSSYSVDIFYRYTFNGREYRSNRWGTQDGSSGGSSAKQKIVDAHPDGSAFTCYVNPQKPWQALGDPYPFPGGFRMLFPLPFLAIGGAGTFSSLRQMLKGKSAPAL